MTDDLPVFYISPHCSDCGVENKIVGVPDNHRVEVVEDVCDSCAEKYAQPIERNKELTMTENILAANTAQDKVLEELEKVEDGMYEAKLTFARAKGGLPER